MPVCEFVHVCVCVSVCECWLLVPVPTRLQQLCLGGQRSPRGHPEVNLTSRLSWWLLLLLRFTLFEEIAFEMVSKDQRRVEFYLNDFNSDADRGSWCCITVFCSVSSSRCLFLR